MKKTASLMILLLVLSMSTFASNPLRFGLEAGVNFSKIKSYDFKYITSFKIGAKTEYLLPMTKASHFMLTSGLFLTEKGGKVDDVVDLRLNAFYLEIPLHVGYKQRLSSSFNLLAEFGPYVAYGLFGKTTQEAYPNQDGGITAREKYDTFDALKRFDMGLGLKFGIEYDDCWQLSWGFDFGLMKAVKEINGNSISKGQNFNTYLSLGYMF